MALIKTDNKHYKEIAGRIRSALSLFEDDIMWKSSELPEAVTNCANTRYNDGKEQGYEQGHLDGWEAAKAEGNYDEGWSDGYAQGWDDGADSAWESGYQEGKREGYQEGEQEGIVQGIEQGERAERTAFWNVLQNNGGTANYYLAFAYNRFTDENYNPQHPIRCSSASTAGLQMFYSSNITDTKVAIYANSKNLQQTFNSVPKLHTIRLLSVHETTTYTNTFDGATALENIEFEGVIGQSINFAQCPKLTKASFTSVMTHLSTTATLTATFSKSAVNRAFETSTGANDGSTSEEWLALVNAVPNATIVLA